MVRIAGTARSRIMINHEMQQVALALAHHEAAHLVVASFLGAPVYSVAMSLRTDDPSKLDGLTRVDQTEMSDRDALVAIFAGPAAEVTFGHANLVEADPSMQGDGSDASRLTEIALRFGDDAAPEFYKATRRAEKLVVTLAYEIRTLARALAARPFVDGVATIGGEDIRPFLPEARYSPW
jgi:hypothetical protein